MATGLETAVTASEGVPGVDTALLTQARGVNLLKQGVAEERVEMIQKGLQQVGTLEGGRERVLTLFFTAYYYSL